MENNSVKVGEESLESLYLKKDFQGAKDYLLKHRDNFNNGQFHYNLGSLDIKLGDYPTARFHLEKALQSGYLHPKVYKNLDAATELLQVSASENDAGYLDRAFFKAKSVPGEAVLCFGLLVLFMLTIAWSRKWLRNKLAMAILTVFALLPIALYLYLQQLTMGIVLKDGTLREGPSKIYSETLKVPAGHKVILGDKNGNWYFIRSPLKYAGWIELERLGLL